jgi:hypothetical protein
MVYRTCWRVLRHAQDSEDAFQATFLILAQKLSVLRGRACLAGRLPVDPAEGAYQRYVGDAAVPGKGEIFVWRPRGS